MKLVEAKREQRRVEQREESQTLGEFRSEDLHGLGLVLVLAALVLARHHDPGGQVGQTDSRVGLVDMLAAGARRAVGVDAQVLLVDLHLVGEVL